MEAIEATQLLEAEEVSPCCCLDGAMISWLNLVNEDCVMPSWHLDDAITTWNVTWLAPLKEAAMMPCWCLHDDAVLG
jgi:hypothetical protein